MSRPGPVELNFVSIGTPTDAKSQDFRKRVRSHVSKRQHQRAREERRTRALERREHLNAAGRVAIEPGPVEPPRLRETEQTDESQVVASIELSRTARNPMDRSFAHGTAAFSTFVLDDADNVIGKALNAFGFDTLGVVTFYDKFIVKQQALNFEMHNESWISKGIAHQKFISIIFTDPALLAAAMLLTTRFLLSRSGKPLPPKVLYHALQFRGFLIQQVTNALSDTKRAVSDAMVATVLLLSAYELTYGDPMSYHVHMTGLVQMIDLRGGMQEIGRSDPYVEGFILWHDSNASTLAGCRPYCEKVKGRSNRSSPEADPDMFRVRKGMAHDASRPR